MTYTWNIASWYTTSMIVDSSSDPIDFEKIKKLNSYLDWDCHGGFTYSKKYIFPDWELLTKCIDCTHTFMTEDGNRICKYSTCGGEPEVAHCNFERRKV